MNPVFNEIAFPKYMVGQGNKWYTNIPENMYPVYPKISPQNHAKYQNLETHSILITHKGPILP